VAVVPVDSGRRAFRSLRGATEKADAAERRAEARAISSAVRLGEGAVMPARPRVGRTAASAQASAWNAATLLPSSAFATVQRPSTPCMPTTRCGILPRARWKAWM
jgi:hypothetical protein